MNLDNSRKQVLKVFSILFVIFSIIFVCAVNKYMNRTVSVSEYLSEKYRNDSIDIVQRTPSIGKYHISKILENFDNDNYSFDMGHSSYDTKLQAYKCEYKLIKIQCNNDGYHKQIHKCAWVQIDFKSNNGDYIITPHVIKVVHAID